MNNKGKIAIAQIIILLIGIISIGYAIGGNIGFVSGVIIEPDNSGALNPFPDQTDSGPGTPQFPPKPVTATNPTGAGGGGRIGELISAGIKLFTGGIGGIVTSLVGGGSTPPTTPATTPVSEASKALTEADAFIRLYGEKPPKEIPVSTITGDPLTRYQAFENVQTARTDLVAAKDAGKDLKIPTAALNKANSELATFGKPELGSTLSEQLLPKSWAGGFWDAAFSGLQWAAVAYGLVQVVGNLAGWEKAQTDALSYAAAAGFGVGKALSVAGYKDLTSVGWGIAAAAVVYYFTYKDVKYKLVRFSCNAWDAEIGSEFCEECNHQILPCSEYQCRSLGQGCELVNKGTENELCVGVNINDANPPTIEPWETPLTQGYRYTPDDAINPPDRGVQIVNENSSDGCVKAFTPLKFGVKLNEPARCRIDALRQDSYEDMLIEITNGLKDYNHTIQFELPGVDNSEQEGIEIENDGNFELYVRCEDQNGNHNLANFVFKYCVDSGPDTGAPYAVGTNIINNMPIASGQGNFDLRLYLNEPSECRWSVQNKDYEQMNPQTQQMDCSTSISQSESFNNQVVWECSANLTGLKDKQENKFYFRCKDQPALAGTNREGDRNINSQDLFYPDGFVIIGTQPLVIEDAGPNGTIRDSAIAVKTTLTAETSAGFKEGESICSHRRVGETGSFVEFLNSFSYQHSTDLYLPEGDYEYMIKCIDLGGNQDTWQVNFTTESDSEAPEVVRVYKEELFLKIITNEDTTCVYTTKGSSYLFEDGIPMTKGSDERSHFIDWDTKNTFYIKCRDEYGNEPNPDEASIIVKPLE